MKSILSALLALFVLVMPHAPSQAQDAKLSAPDTAEANAQMSVVFEGPDGAGDWVGLAPVGSSPGSWVGSSYAYTNAGSPAVFPAPPEHGKYEIRYVTGASAVLASRIVEILPVGGTAAPASASPESAAQTATLSAPETVTGGGEILVEFSGPGGGSYLTILRATDPSVQKLSGSYAEAATSPARMRIPAEAGDWEIRYVHDGRIVGRRALRIAEPPAVTFESRKAAPGEDMEIAFEGGQRVPGDYMYIARPGAPDDDYSGGYSAIEYKGPVGLKAPAEKGEWEMRYVVPFGGGYKALGRATLTVE